MFSSTLKNGPSIPGMRRPPGAPPFRDASDYSSGFRWSVIIHAAFLAIVVFKSLVFPGRPIPYIPTLRVDLVGLPDVLKKDLSGLPKESGSMDKIKEALKNADEQIRQSKEARLKEIAAQKAAEKAETAERDEMLVKKSAVVKGDSDLAKSKAREKKMKNALARMKALERIRSEATPSTSTTPGVLLKGNKISRGTQVSGEARESDQANYYDSLRSRLQDNWALPVWVARQKLSAQVQIFIDSRGRLRSFRFVKLSGNSQFDTAVKQCLTDSQPLPLPPESVASSVLVDGILIGFPL